MPRSSPALRRCADRRGAPVRRGGRRRIVGKLAIGALADRIPKKTSLLANFALVLRASVLLLFVARPGLLRADLRGRMYDTHGSYLLVKRETPP